MLLDCLRGLAQRVEGVEALLLISHDGLVVEKEGSCPLDFEMLAAEITALVSAISDNHNELDSGPIQSFRVDTDKYRLLIYRVNDDFSLLFVAAAAAALGRARFELRRAPLALAAELGA